MSIELINRLQADIIEHIALRFGFLTVSQMQVLTGKSAGYIREMVGSLTRMGYLKSFRVEISYKVRGENCYFATPQCIELLQSHSDAFGDYKIPASSPVIVRDYFHRTALIWCHLSIYLHLKSLYIPILALDAYYSKTGSIRKGNMAAKTKIPLDDGKAFYIPDGAIRTEKALYLLEQYSDRDVKRIINSLAGHARGITLGAPGHVYNIQANPFVLAVFSHTGVKKSVIKKLSANPHFEALSKLFFFATLDDVKKDCATAWKTIYNEPLNFI